MSTIKELLGTDNRKEQEAKIEGLLSNASKPVIDLVIRYDHLADQISLTVIGGDIAFDTIHRMLDLTRQAVRQQEVATALSQQQFEAEQNKEVEE
jgi:hypothetical protein